MATVLEINDKLNYDNKIDIAIKTTGTISSADMTTMQDAIEIILTTAKKYYEQSPIIEMLEES